MQAHAALELADQLKAESDRLLHVDPAGALRTAERISKLAELARDARIRALGELAVGDAQRELGQFRAALESYAHAAELYLQIGDEVGWARTRIGASATWRYTGISQEALREIDRAREILDRHGLWLRLARLEQHAGSIFSITGQFDQATQAFERALAAARRLEPRDEPQEARILGNLALAWQRLGDYERAEVAHAQAVDVFRAHGHLRELARAQANSAQLLLDGAHYSRALEMATSSRRTFGELGHTNDAALAGRVATHCLLELGRFEDAVALASRVADEFNLAGAAITCASTWLLRSIGLRRLSRYAEALADLERAESVFTASNCQGWAAVVRSERAALFGAMGDWQRADAHAADAAAELTALGQHVSAAQASLVEVSALRHLGQIERAHALTRDVLRRIAERSVPWLEYQAWRNAGELAVIRSEEATALAAFESAVGALEQVQGRILTEARANYLADKLDVYESVVGLYLARGEHGMAFDFAERAKSRALVDALAGRLDIRIRPRTSSQQRLADELTRLRRRHEQLALRSVTTLDASDVDATPHAVSAAELADCERGITELLDELRLNNVEDLERVALLQGKVFRLEVDRRTRLLEYFALGDDLCVFVQSHASVQGRRLPGARKKIDRLAVRLSLGMQAAAALAPARSPQLNALASNIRYLLGALYTEAIGPVADLLTGADRLVVVPHGALHRIPFAALHDGEQYLVQRFEIAHGPSASALAFCRRPLTDTTGRALVVAHSSDGALPGALREANRIAALLGAECVLEKDATRARIVARAHGAELIHLATHGESRPDAPLFSFVRLEDGHLTALDCFDLELDCALVTLSACESGHADVVAGDEAIGVPRALLYAGARSVLQTLWRVDDESTAELMERFYVGLQAGQDRSASLRAAQLHVLRRADVTTHPFFWAPLVLIGEWGPVRRKERLG